MVQKCNVRIKVIAWGDLELIEEYANRFLADLDADALVDVKIGRAGDMHSVMILYREHHQTTK